VSLNFASDIEVSVGETLKVTVCWRWGGEISRTRSKFTYFSDECCASIFRMYESLGKNLSFFPEVGGKSLLRKRR